MAAFWIPLLAPNFDNSPYVLNVLCCACTADKPGSYLFQDSAVAPAQCPGRATNSTKINSAPSKQRSLNMDWLSLVKEAKLRIFKNLKQRRTGRCELNQSHEPYVLSYPYLKVGHPHQRNMAPKGHPQNPEHHGHIHRQAPQTCRRAAQRRHSK